MRPDTKVAREYLNQLRNAHDYLEQIKKDLDAIVPLSASKADAIRTNRGNADGIPLCVQAAPESVNFFF